MIVLARYGRQIVSAWTDVTLAAAEFADLGVVPLGHFVRPVVDVM